MTKPWERDDDFLLLLNSTDKASRPLEPRTTSIRSAFAQRLQIPLTLSTEWSVALLKLIYTKSYCLPFETNSNRVEESDWRLKWGVTGKQQRAVTLPHKHHYDSIEESAKTMSESAHWMFIPNLSPSTPNLRCILKYEEAEVVYGGHFVLKYSPFFILHRQGIATYQDAGQLLDNALQDACAPE